MKYYFELSYMNANWNPNSNTDRFPKYAVNYDGIVGVKNFENMKNYVKGLISQNIEENQEYYKDIEKKFDEIEDNINIYLNDCNPTKFYVAEKCGYLKSLGIVPIVQVIFHKITKENALDFVGRNIYYFGDVDK